MPHSKQFAINAYWFIQFLCGARRLEVVSSLLSELSGSMLKISAKFSESLIGGEAACGH